jgi:ribonucleotide monophosphatase NagD (HAD superfamily)
MGGTVTYHGKPHAQIYDEAWKRFASPTKNRILAVGDSIRTDISGGKNFGFDVIWNIAGIHREEIKTVINNHGETDTIDSGVLKHFINDYDQNAPLPDYVLNELKW